MAIDVQSCAELRTSKGPATSLKWPLAENLNMKHLVIFFALLLIGPAAAHHPGSVHELDPTLEQLVHRLPDVQTSFADWEAQAPGFVELQQIGNTGVANQPLEVIRITDERVAFDEANTPLGHKFRIYLDGGHHGNEFLGTELVMYYLSDIIDTVDERAEFWATHELYALPILNVEGNFLDTRKNMNQVDVNRNYGFMFGGPGSGDLVVDLNYRGPQAFSEPEVAANAEFARSIMPDVWITMHSGVAEFYWPWGWTFDKAPDWEFFESIEEPFENATHGTVDAMMAAELYLAAGATDDWGYGQLGVPTHTYEVHGDQFIPAYLDGVSTVIQDQLDGLHWVVDNTRHWGATLSIHTMGDELHIWNEGWGKAVNVTVTIGGEATMLDEIGPGNMTVLPMPSEPVRVAYKQLIIDAPEAKTRYVNWEPLTFSDAPNEETVPGATLALLLIGLTFLTWRRR